MIYLRLFAIVFPLLLTTLLQAEERKQPNILFAFADDWGRYASIYADEKVDGPGSVNDVIKTPHFDRVAREGVLFRHAFVTAPSCTPCRSSLLSGQYFYRTGRAAILQGAIWDNKIPTYPLLLRNSGYHIGKVYKVWSPGSPRDEPYGGQKYNFSKGGPNFNGFSQTATKMVQQGISVEAAKQTLLKKVDQDFQGFLKARQENQPFCYWFGPTNVHRKWVQGSGKKLWGLNPDDLKGKMPKFLPDVPIVREDFADYLGESMAFDAALGVLLKRLEAEGELENTLIVVSGDHGAPGFPRGKCNLYDFGTGVALAAMWKGKGGIPAGRVVDDFVNLMDLAPTFLEAGGVKVPEVMTGKSLLPVFQSEKSGQVDPQRAWVVTGRERHVAQAREGNLPYPQRAIRTKDYLFIRNFKPDRWPMGNPRNLDQLTYQQLANNTFVTHGDLDASPTKAWMVAHRNDPKVQKQYDLGFNKRPARELYILQDDPDQIMNVADSPEHQATLEKLEAQLMRELRETNDPRVVSDDPPYEHPPFTNPK